MKFRAGIAGHGGYSGAELVRILSRHPDINLQLLDRETIFADRLDVVFLATPYEASVELAPRLLATGARVIDLSGAFRLATPVNHERWYNDVHPAPEWLAQAVYGLPEFYRDRIPHARLLANPGCYPTAANLAIRPLIEHGVADLNVGIVCDAKSGVSGAGRKASLTTSFCEVANNFSAYAVLDHRHVPEILMNSGLSESQLSLTAHLLPLDRGILETIYFRLARPLDAPGLVELYRHSYDAEPFIRIHPAGSLPDLHSVVRTNFCDIGVRLDPPTGRGVIVAAIDNLVKGAAGQAIQNMNLMLGYPETEALL